MKAVLRKLEDLLALGGRGKDILLLVVGGLSVGLSLMEQHLHFRLFPFDGAWFAIVFCGLPIVLEAIAGLGLRFDVKADVLVSVALIASVCIGQEFAAGEVAVIMRLGSLLEDLTVRRARRGLERLAQLRPQQARRLSGGEQSFVPVEDVHAGDVLRVLAGETVPVDGVILAGETSIDQAVMTGESMPVDKGAGDEVSSGTQNLFGTFDMRVTRVGEDSSIQRMIRLVESADAEKAKIVRLADSWATWIVVLALAAALITWSVTGEVIRGVTILVVFCPCALVLATPTAIMAAIGNAAQHGFLVREGDALERLARVKAVAFDKTGTLTTGRPGVRGVLAFPGFTREEVFAAAAGAEKRSEHPLGKAIVQAWEKPVPEPESFVLLPGKGVRARVEGRTVLAGNERLLAEHAVSLDPAAGEAWAEEGSTLVWLAIDGVSAGCLALADTLRPEGKTLIDRLGAMGISPLLLTGDRPAAARAVAARLGISRVAGQCLPEDKLRELGSLQKEGTEVCMLGDGINDAPALKKANVGIAMGGVGSDIAVEAADIALVSDELRELPHLLALSRRMMVTIRLNLAFSMGLNLLAVVLAAAGLLGPVPGALMHNLGSVLVIVHSALLLRWKGEREAASPRSRLSPARSERETLRCAAETDMVKSRCMEE